MKLDRPIFIVGAPRSGTTLLGEILSVHPGVAYWEEPRTIWEIGNAYGREDDVLTESDVTPGIARKIESRFARFLEARGGTRFLEKTPVNLLRLKFVHALFPEGRILFLVRDGPATVASQLCMRRRPPRWRRLLARIRETPVSALPALAWRGLARRRFQLRPPGWRDFSGDPAERAAQQWVASQEAARRDLEDLPSGSFLEIRYEEFVRDPSTVLEPVLDFCGLTGAEEVRARAGELVDPSRAERAVPREVEEAFSRVSGLD